MKKIIQVVCVFVFTQCVYSIDPPVITNISRDGDLTYFNPSGSPCSLEWAPTPFGPWYSDWSNLQNIITTDQETTVHVPFMFRVKVENITNCLGYLNPLPTVTSVDSNSTATVTNGPIVCTTRHVNLAKNYEDIILFSPLFDIVPGSIISAKSILDDGLPDFVTVYQQPLELELQGLGIVDNTRTVNDPWSGTINSAINDMLQSNYQDASTPAIISVDVHEVYSKEQVFIDAGVSLAFGSDDLNIGGGFDFGNISEKNSIFIKIIQRYYTCKIRPKSDGKYYLDDLCQNIQSQLVNENDVPAIITHVHYGRILLYQMTNSKEISHSQMEASFKAKILGSGEYNETMRSIFETSDKRVLVIGGDPNAAVQVLTNEDAGSFLNAGLYWSLTSPGVPISYQVSYLTPGMPTFKYGKSTEFTLEECTINGGDNLWTVGYFHCDSTHNNDFILQRTGSPVCGTSNCRGCFTPPNWPNLRKSGGSYGEGSLSINFNQDHQYYGRTYLYVQNETVLPPIPFSANVGHVWLNNVHVTSNPLYLTLQPGCNILEVTAYNQNSGGYVRVQDALAEYVDRMDSDSCE